MKQLDKLEYIIIVLTLPTIVALMMGFIEMVAIWLGMVVLYSIIVFIKYKGEL